MRSPPRSEPRSDGYRLIDRFKFYPVPAEWLQVGCYPILMSLILAPAMGFASGWCRASEPRTCHWTRAAERSWTRDKDLSCMCMCKCCSSRYSLAVYKTHAWQHAPARLCPTSRSSATCVRSVNTVCLANMWITHYLVQAHVWTQIPPAVTVTMIQWPWKCLVISFKEPLGLIMLMAPPSCTACHCMSLHVTTCHRMFACCWSSVLQLRTKVLAKWLAPLHWCARSAVIAPGSAFHSAWAPRACMPTCTCVFLCMQWRQGWSLGSYGFSKQEQSQCQPQPHASDQETWCSFCSGPWHGATTCTGLQAKGENCPASMAGIPYGFMAGSPEQGVPAVPVCGPLYISTCQSSLSRLLEHAAASRPLASCV